MDRSCVRVRRHPTIQARPSCRQAQTRGATRTAQTLARAPQRTQDDGPRRYYMDQQRTCSFLKAEHTLWRTDPFQNQRSSIAILFRSLCLSPWRGKPHRSTDLCVDKHRLGRLVAEPEPDRRCDGRRLAGLLVCFPHPWRHICSLARAPRRCRVPYPAPLPPAGPRLLNPAVVIRSHACWRGLCWRVRSAPTPPLLALLSRDTVWGVFKKTKKLHPPRETRHGGMRRADRKNVENIGGNDG